MADDPTQPGAPDPADASPGSSTPTSDDSKAKPAKMDVALASAGAEAEADSGASDPGPTLTETAIRNKGWSVDLPFEAAGPQDLSYSDKGDAEEWKPPAGWDDGMPGIDHDLAQEMGVPDMSAGPQSEGGTTESDEVDQPLPPPEDEDAASWVSEDGPGIGPYGP